MTVLRWRYRLDSERVRIFFRGFRVIESLSKVGSPCGLKPAARYTTGATAPMISRTAVGVLAVAIAIGSMRCDRPSREDTLAFKAAIQQGDRAAVEGLLRSNPALLEATFDEAQSPMHLAAVAGRSDLVELFVARGGAIDKMDSTGKTPLMCAAGRPHDEVIRTLLRCGASTGLSANGDTSAIHRSASNGNWRHIKILLEHGVDVNLRLKSGTTPLHAAAALGYVRTVEFLLASGADFRAEDVDGRTAKVAAAAGGYYVVRDLLDKHERPSTSEE